MLYGHHNFNIVTYKGWVTLVITTWIRIGAGFIRSWRLQSQQITITGNTLVLAVPWILLVNSFFLFSLNSLLALNGTD
jgi:hypothetical protein